MEDTEEMLNTPQATRLFDLAMRFYRQKPPATAGDWGVVIACLIRHDEELLRSMVED